MSDGNFEFVVENSQNMKRLDNFLVQCFGITRAETKIFLQSKKVLVNGKVCVKKDYKLKNGDRVNIVVENSGEISAIQHNNEMNVGDNPTLDEHAIRYICTDESGNYPCPVMDEDGYIIIDGTLKEGGGQILRNSVALSALLEKPISIQNVRGKRERPGLQPQHLTGINLIQEFYNADVSGNVIKSTELKFKANNYSAGEYIADTKTAGSICLLIQIALPCLCFASQAQTVQFKGGTNAAMAPHIDYITEVFHPIAQQFGMQFEIDIKKRGYYPKGGGDVVMHVQPLHHLKPITMLDVGVLKHILIRVFMSGVNLTTQVGDRMARFAQNQLIQTFGKDHIAYDIQIERDENGIGTGIGIVIIAETTTGCRFGSSALGERGLKAEKVGAQAATRLIHNIKHGACTDEYLQDQLIIYCALAKGHSKFTCGPITTHTETSIHFVQLLTGAKFNVEKSSDDTKSNTYIVSCDGIGYENKYIH